MNMTENLKQQRNEDYWWSLNVLRTLAVFVVNIWKTMSRLTLVLTLQFSTEGDEVGVVKKHQ